MIAASNWPADPAAPKRRPATTRPVPGFDPSHPYADTAAQKAAHKSKLHKILDEKAAQSVGLAPTIRTFTMEGSNRYGQLLYDAVYVLTFGVVVIPLLIVLAIVEARVLVGEAPAIWDWAGRIMG